MKKETSRSSVRTTLLLTITVGGCAQLIILSGSDISWQTMMVFSGICALGTLATVALVLLKSSEPSDRMGVIPFGELAPYQSEALETLKALPHCREQLNGAGVIDLFRGQRIGLCDCRQDPRPHLAIYSGDSALVAFLTPEGTQAYVAMQQATARMLWPEGVPT